MKCVYEGCGKCFRTSTQRIEHEGTHSKERPYICEIDGCGRAFGFARRLKYHIEYTHRKKLSKTIQNKIN